MTWNGCKQTLAESVYCVICLVQTGCMPLTKITVGHNCQAQVKKDLCKWKKTTYNKNPNAYSKKVQNLKRNSIDLKNNCQIEKQSAQLKKKARDLKTPRNVIQSIEFNQNLKF